MNIFSSQLLKLMAGESNNSFAKRIGSNRQTVANILESGEASGAFIGLLLQAYPRLSLDWLYKGEGEMFLEETKPDKVSSGWSQDYRPSNDIRVNSAKAKEVSENANENPIVQFLMEQVRALQKDKEVLQREKEAINEELQKYKNR